MDAARPNVTRPSFQQRGDTIDLKVKAICGLAGAVGCSAAVLYGVRGFTAAVGNEIAMSVGAQVVTLAAPVIGNGAIGRYLASTVIEHDRMVNPSLMEQRTHSEQVSLDEGTKMGIKFTCAVAVAGFAAGYGIGLLYHFIDR